MKYLLSLAACMCMFMFVGSMLPAHSQSARIKCSKGECVTTVNTSPDSWDMTIDCGDGPHFYSGDGAWEGSLCGVSVSFA